MKRLRTLFLFAAAFVIVLGAGCKKDDGANPGENSRELNVKTLTVPDAMSQSSDPGAQQAAGYISLANSMAGMSALMVPPKSTPATHSKENGTPSVYNWTVDEGDDNYSVTLTIYETDELYRWEMKVDGIMDGHEIDNFLFIKAEQYKDEHDNSFIVYDWEKPGTPSLIMHWHTTDDLFYLTLELPENEKISFVINADNSGSIDAAVWKNNEYVRTYTASWDATGHGEYKEYDENGAVINQGSW